MKTNQYQKLERFPLGSIHAEGFLKQQLQLCKNGIGGHLHELEPEMIARPFVDKVHVDAWVDGDQDGWGAEISGNYWSGYIQLAYTLHDDEMMETATQWVNAVLQKQRPDGYLGTYSEPDAKIFEDYNAWGTACFLRGLIAYYEATSREEVLTAVHNCLLWFCNTWAGDRKTCYMGQFIIEPMIFVYQLTGDERLLGFAEEYMEFLCRRDIFLVSYKQMLSDRYYYNTDHTAGMGIHFRLPALVYSATGKVEYLLASAYQIEKIRAKSVQLSGSPVSVTEYLGPVGSTTECEYCSYAFYNAGYSCMSYITGDPKYGDYMEELFYNGAQGARKKDEKAIAYLNAPNQIFATVNSSSAVRDMQVYAPCYPTACCPVNAVAVLPEFVRGMLLHDAAGNVYVAAYGPCSLTYGGVQIEERTMYPFRNRVRFTIHSDHKFALNLKIPQWSRSHTVLLNGIPQICKTEGGYTVVEREWHSGDTVEISFAAEVEVICVDDRDFAGHFPLAVKYGALLFAYHIPEKWRKVAGRPMTPLPDGWSWYQVFPSYTDEATADSHEMLGLRREHISWNIALDEHLTAEDFEIEETDGERYPWTDPPVRLHTRCYRAPYLCAPYAERTFEPFGEYQYVTEQLPLELVPYGCTNLRITYFPKADLKDRNKNDS